MVRGQLDRLSGSMRSFLFKTVINSKADVRLRLSLLAALSESGRKLAYFEMEIGSFLLQWLPLVHCAGECAEFYRILTSVIKFNTACIMGEHVVGFVR